VVRAPQLHFLARELRVLQVMIARFRLPGQAELLELEQGWRWLV